MSGPTTSFETLGDVSRLPRQARMECGVCWTVYDPALGDDYWQVQAGTPFAELPPHWSCPNCDAPKTRFIRSGETEDDPAARLCAYYQEVDQTRMADLPIRNPALVVEVVDLIPWRGGHLAVLVTPWCLNLVYLPTDLAHEDWREMTPGREKIYSFPAGRFSFVGADLPALGPIQSCYLLSPMAGFKNQGSVRAMAAAILDALHDVENRTSVDAGTALFEDPNPQELDRRRFLRGKFSNPNGDTP